MPFVIGALTFAACFFLLRAKGGFLRHLIAVIIAAIVMPVLSMLSFRAFHPHGGKPSYHSQQVWEAMQLATLAYGGAIVLGLLAGIIVTAIMRRKSTP